MSVFADSMDLKKKILVDILARACLTLMIVPMLIFLASLFMNQPRVYIQDVYVPSLSPTLNKTTTFNTSVFIDLKFQRTVALTRYTYADFQMTLFYGDRWRLLVADHIVEGFSMGQSTRVHVKAMMEAPGLPWEEASRAVSHGEEVKLAVQLVMYPCARKNCTCWIKFEMSAIEPSAIAAYVMVDASGHKVSKKPIRLY